MLIFQLSLEPLINADIKISASIGLNWRKSACRCEALANGERVSNTLVTYPEVEHSQPKGWVILHVEEIPKSQDASGAA